MGEKTHLWKTLERLTDHEFCGFPPHLFKLVTMSVFVGERETGEHIYSLPKFAARLGISVSTLKRYLFELDQLVSEGRSPVAIERRRRGRPDGTGRSSDLWRVVLLDLKSSPVEPLSSADAGDSSEAQELTPACSRAQSETSTAQNGGLKSSPVDLRSGRSGDLRSEEEIDPTRGRARESQTDFSNRISDEEQEQARGEAERKARMQAFGPSARKFPMSLEAIQLLLEQERPGDVEWTKAAALRVHKTIADLMAAEEADKARGAASAA